MSAGSKDYAKALERAKVHALEWLESIPDRPVGARAGAATLRAGFSAPLPASPTDPGRGDR